jgi:hypothetical protein
VQIVSTPHAGEKEYRLVKCYDRRPFLAHGSLGAPRSQGGFRLAYAQKIEIEMRPAIFYFDLR